MHSCPRCFPLLSPENPRRLRVRRLDPPPLQSLDLPRPPESGILFHTTLLILSVFCGSVRFLEFYHLRCLYPINLEIFIRIFSGSCCLGDEVFGFGCIFRVAFFFAVVLVDRIGEI